MVLPWGVFLLTGAAVHAGGGGHAHRAPPSRLELTDLGTTQHQVAGGPGDNRQLVWLNETGHETARCLDGSPYAFYIWPGNSSDWSIFINGGGWCLTEGLCEARAGTALGSSKGYNISGAWGPPPGNINGGPPAYTCQGLDSNCTRVFLPYCDGSCFTSSRPSPWPVNGSNASLSFRGMDNLDSTLDVLASQFGLGQAKRVVVQGGSAGGLSTYLHVDHIADRVRAANAGAAVGASPGASAATPSGERGDVGSVRVVGRPVAGFFIDEENFNPGTPSYAQDIQYGVAMFNSTPVLSSACKAAHPTQLWKCWMAPYAAPFVRESIFAVQSRFDEFQLKCLLGLPCFAHQSFEPPFLPSTCNDTERAAIVTFGAALLSQLQPLLKAKPDTGTWLVSCIQHDVVCPLGGVQEVDAFASWLAGGELGREIGYRWFDTCGHNGTTPCDLGDHCAPPHF